MSNRLPTLHRIVDRLADRIEKQSLVGVLVFDASPLDAFEHRHGAEAFDELIDAFGDATREMCGSHLRERDIVCRDAPAGDTVLVFLTPPRDHDDTDGPPAFAEIAERTKNRVQTALDPDAFADAIDRVQTGSALIVSKTTVDPRRQIYRAIRRAHRNIRERREQRLQKLHNLVGNVITREQIRTLYQPIVELGSGETLGFEALSRPANDFAEQLGLPLFSAAQKVELQAELDQLCRTLSVDRRPELEADRKLFINCLPVTFYESSEALDRLLDRWTDHGLRPEQLIFEINENISQPQADRILPTVRRLRADGYQFALDDMGTGKTNLRLLAELEPTFIKMDISLTRDIGENIRKQALASYLLDLADKSDARLIAEGIESERELETIIELGVDLGQGHLIGRPEQID